MKIRLGFVSNSSSTSYVIALTRDFRATPEQLDKFIEECGDVENIKLTPEQATKSIGKIVEALCSRGDWSWVDFDIGIDNFHPFMWACGDSIKISEADAGHGCDFLHNILADDLRDKTIKLITEEDENEN